MKRLNVRKYALQGIQHPTAKSFALAGLTSVLLVGLYPKSDANPSPGQIYWVSTTDQRLVGVRSGNGANGQAEKIVLRDRSQALAIAPGGYSAHVAVPGHYVRATSQGRETALYRYPCRFKGKGIYTIGYRPASNRSASDNNCTFTVAPPPKAQLPGSTNIHPNSLSLPWSTSSLPFSWLTSRSSKSLHPQKIMLAQAGQQTACFQTPTGQECVPCTATSAGTVCPIPSGASQYLPDAKPTLTQDDDADSPSISVAPAPNTNDAILYQARFDESNNQIAIHVISGTVIVTPTAKQPVSVSQGNKFVYSAASDAGTVTPGIEVDKNEVQEFLRPPLWPSLEAELQQFNQDVGPRVAGLGSANPGSVTFPNSQTLTGHSDAVRRVSWSPDGQILASGSADGTVRLWQQDGTFIITLPKEQGCLYDNCYVYSVAWSPKGETLAVATPRQIRLWRRDGSPITTKALPESFINDLSWSPDGQTLVGAAGGTLRLWRWNGTSITSITPITVPKDLLKSVAWSPDGQTIAGSIASADTPTVYRWRWNGTNGTPLSPLMHAEPLTRVSWSPDGKILASASIEGTVRLWQQDGTSIVLKHGSPGVLESRNVVDLSWSKDGQVLASGTREGTIRLWQRDGTLITTFKGTANGLTSLSWSPDGQTLAVGSSDNTVLLWRR